MRGEGEPTQQECDISFRDKEFHAHVRLHTWCRGVGVECRSGAPNNESAFLMDAWQIVAPRPPASDDMTGVSFGNLNSRITDTSASLQMHSLWELIPFEMQGQRQDYRSRAPERAVCCS